MKPRVSAITNSSMLTSESDIQLLPKTNNKYAGKYKQQKNLNSFELKDI